jgi:hypothetical protein
VERLKNMSKRPEKSESKWKTITDCTLNDNNWSEIYHLPYQATIDTKLRILQYKILYRLLPVNTWLTDVALLTLIHAASVK